MRRNTRREIIEAFVSMVKETSLSRVRIADIIQELGINRNTFYYHFQSKYDVAMCIFREDLDRALRRAVPDRELVCSPLNAKGSNDKQYAYYAHSEIGARTLDGSAFFKALIGCVIANRELYLKLFDRRELDFALCVRNLYYPEFRDDIKFVLDGRYMPEETLRMMTTLCTDHLLSTVEFCLRSPCGEEMLDERANPFWNIVHESISAAIQAHPINRYSTRSRQR